VSRHPTTRFFLQPTVDVARGLLGMMLRRVVSREQLRSLLDGADDAWLADLGDPIVLQARIVETEAYTQNDPACHAVRMRRDGQCESRPSPRNAALFGPPRHAYVYFTYGMHWALNVVAQPAGIGEGVLIRAAAPMAGQAVMAALRRLPNLSRQLRCGETSRPKELATLTAGPARLAQALAVTGALNGHDLTATPLELLTGDPLPEGLIQASQRIGIRKGVELPYRFFVRDCPFVSR